MDVRTKYTYDVLKPLVATSSSLASVLRHLGLQPTGGNYRQINRWLKYWGIDKSHFTQGSWSRGLTAEEHPSLSRAHKRMRHEDVFCKNSRCTKRTLRREYLRVHTEYQCTRCGISEWMKEPLTLHLDHINGDHTDNRLANLRWLCPNCHVQTPTYSNKKRDNFLSVLTRPAKQSPTRLCSCGKQISIRATKCKSCAASGKTKIMWPDISRLEELVWSHPLTKVAEYLGVSDRAVSKRCKKLGINPPPAGHWLKKI